MDEQIQKLGRAMFRGDLSTVERIDSEFPSALTELETELKQPLVEFTVGKGHVGIVRFLLDAGFDPNHFGGSTPLCKAIHARNDEMIELLLSRGADPNLDRPMISCIAPEHTKDQSLKYLELMIRHGAEVNRKYDLSGDSTSQFTVLDWAKDPEIMELLRSHGARHATELSADG